jgi:hypothetical protein
MIYWSPDPLGGYTDLSSRFNPARTNFAKMAKAILAGRAAHPTISLHEEGGQPRRLTTHDIALLEWRLMVLIGQR